MLVSLVSHSSQVTSTLSSRTQGSGGYDLGPCWRKDQPLQVQREDRREVRMRFCFEVGHRCVFLRRQRQPSLHLSAVGRPYSHPYLSSTSAIGVASLSSTSAIVAAVTALDVGHCCSCSRLQFLSRRWPLLWSLPSLTWAIIAAVAVVNINSFICNHIVVIDALCTY